MKSKISWLVAGLCLIGTAPAFADWDNIGQVDVGFKADRDARNLDLGGPVERLQLSAMRSDVYCSAVTASFGNGRTSRIYQGFIRQGRSVSVDMPGTAVDLNRLAFNCGAEGRSGATVRIAADIGRYRDTWRRNPNWSRVWARMFNWANNPPPPPPGGGWHGNPPPPGGAMTGPGGGWNRIGAESFDGPNDQATSFSGWKGQNARKLGLTPIGTAARCSRVSAQFGNRQTADLHLNFGTMAPGQVYSIDLPGVSRDVVAINLRCHAVNGGHVTIQIFAR